MFELETTLDRRSDPAIRHYLATIGRYPLLGPQQERELARRARDGDKDALDALVNANLRFVVSVARGFLNRGLGFMDLVAEGNVGLITAARRFDEDRGNRFVTYAVWWIRQSIGDALQNQVRSVRLPANQARLIPAIMQAQQRLAQAAGGAARAEDLAQELGIPVDRLVRIQAASGPTVSLDSRLDDHDESGGDSPTESLVDESWESPLDRLVSDQLGRSLAAAIGHLDDREKLILARHYGLDQDDADSLVTIGSALALSRERTRQLRNRALGKLRRHLGGTTPACADLRTPSSVFPRRPGSVATDGTMLPAPRLDETRDREDDRGDDGPGACLGHREAQLTPAQDVRDPYHDERTEQYLYEALEPESRAHAALPSPGTWARLS